MKKKIEIKKKVEFSSMIGEVCAISLENHLHFVDDSSIEGDFVLLGRYKATTASRLEEEFQYEIPVEIALMEKVDPATGVIDITDFYYDIADGNSLLCNIEVEIEAEEIVEEERECDGDPVEEKEIEIPHLEETPVEEEEEREEQTTNTDTDFFHLNLDQETYGTFIVYIVRQNETINSILEKYHTSVEELEKYNNIKDLSIGTKVIIPVTNEKDT